MTALYRHYDSTGALLYIGISCSHLRRLAEHSYGSHWSNNIAIVTVEQFATWGEAERAEKEFIKKERPAHNTTHNRTKKSVSQPNSLLAAKDIFQLQCDLLHKHVDNLYTEATTLRRKYKRERDRLERERAVLSQRLDMGRAENDELRRCFRAEVSDRLELERQRTHRQVVGRPKIYLPLLGWLFRRSGFLTRLRGTAFDDFKARHEAALEAERKEREALELRLQRGARASHCRCGVAVMYRPNAPAPTSLGHADEPARAGGF